VAWERLIPLIGNANRSLARYDGVLYGVPNLEVMLSTLTTQEAVLSSKIEGTQATLGEVLKFEAGKSRRVRQVGRTFKRSSTTERRFGPPNGS
jgi:hypothetical protein